METETETKQKSQKAWDCPVNQKKLSLSRRIAIENIITAQITELKCFSAAVRCECEREEIAN